MASMIVDLPEPVGPSRRKRPARPTAAKSMVSVPAYGPIAVIDRWCSCTSAHLLRLGEVLGPDRRLVAGREDVDLAAARLGLGDVGDEVGAELARVALADDGGAGPRPRGGAVGLVEHLQGVREARLDAVHEGVGADAVGDGDAHPRRLGGRVLGGLEELLESAPQRGHRPRLGDLDRGDAGRAGRVEVDEERDLRVVLLGEGVAQRRARVAHDRALGRLGRLRAVQVPQRRVVDAVEGRAGDAVDAADHDRALRVARLGAGHERVREDDRAHPRPVGEVGADAVARGADDGLVRSGERLAATGQRDAGVVGVEVGDAVDRGPDAVAALEQDRQVELAEVGDHADALAEEARAVAEADRGVVVSRGDDERGDGREPREGPLEQLDRLDGRDAAVVHVAGHEHRVDRDAVGRVLDELAEALQDSRLRLVEVDAVERPPEVPVGGVEQPHATTVGPAADTSDADTPDDARHAATPRGRHEPAPGVGDGLVDVAVLGDAARQSLLTKLRIIETNVMMSEPRMASQKKCSTWKDRLSLPEIHDVSWSIRALTMKTNRPSVRMMNGSDSSLAMGRMNALMMPKISATMTTVLTISPVEPSPNVMPGMSHAATQRATALMTVWSAKLMSMRSVFHGHVRDVVVRAECAPGVVVQLHRRLVGQARVLVTGDPRLEHRVEPEQIGLDHLEVADGVGHGDALDAALLEGDHLAPCAVDRGLDGGDAEARAEHAVEGDG